VIPQVVAPVPPQAGFARPMPAVIPSVVAPVPPQAARAAPPVIPSVVAPVPPAPAAGAAPERRGREGHWRGGSERGVRMQDR
jgi:hypothetical protein